jgi:hypothetical protein
MLDKGEQKRFRTTRKDWKRKWDSWVKGWDWANLDGQIKRDNVRLFQDIKEIDEKAEIIDLDEMEWRVRYRDLKRFTYMRKKYGIKDVVKNGY